MAIVRITNDLKEQIIQNVRSYYAPKLNAATQNVNGNWGSRLYAIVIGNRYGKALSAVHSDFLRHITRTTVNEVPTKTGITLSLSLIVEFGSKPFPLSNGASKKSLEPYVSSSGYSDYWSLKRVPSDPVWEQLLDELVAYHSAIQAVKDETAAAVSTIEKLLSQHSTLAPALKAWPTLWNMLPEWAKDKHKLIKEVTPKPELNLGTLDKMTSEIMAKRILDEEES